MKRIITLLTVLLALLLSITVVGAEEIPEDVEEDPQAADGADADAEVDAETDPLPEIDDALTDTNIVPEPEVDSDLDLEADPAPDTGTVIENGDTNLLPEEEQHAVQDDIRDTGESLFNAAADKVMAFVEQHKDTIIMVVGFIASIYMAISEKRVRKKTSRENAESQSLIMSDIEGVKEVQDKMIEGYNALSDAYNAMREKYAEYEDIEDDRNKLVGAVLVQQETLLEIVTSVYTNSSNLPQGEKDLILYKYSKCLSTLDNDDKLRECVKAVRGILSKDTNARE